MELELTNALLVSRDSFETISRYITLDKKPTYSREFQHLYKFICAYYKRDKDAQAVSIPVLLGQIEAATDNPKHVDTFRDFIERAAATQSSHENVVALVLAAKQRELEIETSIALVDRSPKARELLEALKSVLDASSLEELDADTSSSVEVLEDIDVEKLALQRLNRDNLFPLYPRAVNDRMDGGVERGDNVTMYGMTEIGKSMFSIHHACGWANAGKPGLYLINEDRKERIGMRMVSCLTNMTRAEVERNPREANERAAAAGLGNIRVIQLAPGTPALIEALVEKYDPAWIVVDQLRNLVTTTRNNRVTQLEEAATAMRNLGKAANIVTITVTQAAESARNKLFLDNGDVDFSNVGIPGQADVMYGIGATEESVRNNERGVSLAKNKITGDHAQLIVRVNPFLSRVYSVN